MKALIYPALIATAIATSAFTFIANPTFWRLKDENYSVKIHSSKFDGVFKGLQTEILFDENNLSSAKIKATIDANSINTGNGMRNKHAKQGLDAQNFNKISFESTSVGKTNNGYEANGRLTIKNVTKDIKLPFTFLKTSDGATFQGKFSVKPSEYTVKKAGTPELIEIELNVPVINQ